MSFEVFGKENCPWCQRAAEDLFMHGKTYVYHDVSKSPERLEELKERVPGVKTVPQIFDPENRLIGGYDRLREYLIATQNKEDFWASKKED